MKKLFLLSIAALAFTSCSNELDESLQSLSNNLVITAQMPEGMSRTTTNALQVLWAEGDQIGVFRTESEVKTTSYLDNCFTLSGGSGTTGASFTAEQASGVDNVMAYYPYNNASLSADKVLTVVLPKEQSYSDGNQMVMIGEFIDGSNSVAFKNAMALAVITVKNIPADYTRAVLTAAGGESLAGTATVSLGTDGVNFTNLSNGSSSLTIQFGENTDTEKRFYFAIPAGTYTEGLTMTLEADNVESYTVGTLSDDNTSKQFTPAINDFFYHTIELNAGVTTIQKVATEEELKAAVEKGGNIKLTADITGISELIKVEKDLVLDLDGHTLGFTPQTGYPGIKNTANLEVKNGKITSTQAGIQNNGTLTINCDVETIGNAINNVYDGETTINGGTYKNTSTELALIYTDSFGDGTPVLTINDGTFESEFTNVSYNNGSTGSVNKGTFKCTGNWHNIYVGGSEGGCNVTYSTEYCTFESNGINIQVSNWGVETNSNIVNGVTYTTTQPLLDDVSTLEGLKSALVTGGDIVLTANITGISELIKVEKDLVLDLGGYTLGFTPQTGYPGIKNTANLEVKNGKITSSEVGIQNNGTLTINCDVETVGNAINNVYDGETTINGGTYKNTSTELALIYTDSFGDGTPVLTINDGTFESEFTNVSYNNGSTGAVNKGTFKCTGNWHNIYVGGSEGGCNVTYNVDNCTFESNGINIQVNDWGKGNTNTVNNTSYTETTTLME